MLIYLVCCLEANTARISRFASVRFMESPVMDFVHGFGHGSRVRLLAALLNLEVIRLLEVARVDLRLVDEIHDVDGPCRLESYLAEVFIVEDDVMARLVLVAPHQLLVLDPLLVTLADAERL